MKLRAARPGDASSIGRIEAQGNTPSWTKAAVAETLALPSTLALVAVDVRGDVCGHLLSTVVVDEAEVLILAVDPRVRRQGLGRALLLAAERAWAERGVVRAWLDVRVDNAPALALYRAAGWRLAGERIGYYRDGTAAAVLELTVSEGGTAGSS